MEFALNEDFDDNLNDFAHAKTRKYKTDIEEAINTSYKDTPGYRSVTVTGFRRGSVIVELAVPTTIVDTSVMSTANAKVVDFLKKRSYNVEDNSFKSTLNENKPFNKLKVILPGDDMLLICEPNANILNTNTKWRVKGTYISNNDKYSISGSQLIVRRVERSDTGRYECVLENSVMFYSQGEDIEIPASPTLKLNFYDRTTQCAESEVVFSCCVQSLYKAIWKEEGTTLSSVPKINNCIEYTYQIREQNCDNKKEFTCEVTNTRERESDRASLNILSIASPAPVCDDNGEVYGKGLLGQEARAGCKPKEEGFRRAICREDGTWELLENTCILSEIKDLKEESMNLDEAALPGFVEKLSNATNNLQDDIAESAISIFTIVDILNTIANVSQNIVINEAVMTDFLNTVDVLVSDTAEESWDAINQNQTQNTSSILLGSIETISTSLSDGSFNINTPLIQLNKTSFTNSFSADLNNSTAQVEIPQDAGTEGAPFSITIITFSSLNNVLPTRNSSSQNDSVNSINANVVLLKVNGTINNVSLSFSVLNETLASPQCVFWNFSLFDGIGGWDDSGCELQSDQNGTVTCNCNHLTSFSILMSPFVSLSEVIGYITFIGVGISIASLVICLIIEACVWKTMTKNSTPYLRHVSIVNVAVSLLIADIWFIIGAAISDQDPTPIPSCRAATFFIHFFYLALFFWMLITGLLLLYRTVMVFADMSKSVMLAIGFTVGYGAPLIIAVITVAVTAPGNAYIRKGGTCWLNWYKSKALLAFVIPALTIVLINLIVLVVVLYKMLKRGVGDSSQPDQRSAMMVVARCLAILTPFFGLTWGLGVGTMIDPTNEAIHGFFAFFNSLQGFFILVFGTLLDKKVRQAISGRLSSANVSSNQTTSTSAGTSSTSGLNIFRRIKKRNVYSVSVPQTSQGSSASESFGNA